MPNNLTDTEETRLLDLGLVDGDLLALVTTLPTDSAAGTEVAGGTYARKAIDWADASNGVKSNAAAIAFEGLPAVDVVAWNVHNAAGTIRKWYGLLSTVQGTSATADSTINATAHGYAAGQKVLFQTGYTPGGLTAGTVYFVRDVTANSFKVATTLGGTAVTLTTSVPVVVGKVLTVPDGAGVNFAVGALACSLT